MLAHGAGSIEWRVEKPTITPRSALRDLLQALVLTAVVSRRRGAPAATAPPGPKAKAAFVVRSMLGRDAWMYPKYLWSGRPEHFVGRK